MVRSNLCRLTEHSHAPKDTIQSRLQYNQLDAKMHVHSLDLCQSDHCDHSDCPDLEFKLDAPV